MKISSLYFRYLLRYKQAYYLSNKKVKEGILKLKTERGQELKVQSMKVLELDEIDFEILQSFVNWTPYFTVPEWLKDLEIRREKVFLYKFELCGDKK